MKMTRTKVAAAALLACLLLAGLTLSATTLNLAKSQTAKRENGIKLRLSGRRVVVRERGGSHALDIWKHVEAAKIDDAREIFLTRGGGFVYLLLDVCGPSKAKPDEHECGAGEECNLIWLKLDEAWRERDAKSVRYDSCWSPIVSYDGLKVSGRTLSLEYDDLRDNTQHELTYDADKPEAGLKDESKPLPKDNP
jgi:hypothetical protein